MSDREAFEHEIAEWTKDVREECLILFNRGVVPEHCLLIAKQIADSRAAQRARTREALIGRLATPAPTRRN